MFTIRKGNIAACIGCGKKTLKDEEYVLKRDEQDWYPQENDGGSKSWRLSVKKPRHYHPRKNECVIPRNPNFVPNMIDFRSLQLTGLTANGRALLKDLGVLNVDD